MAFGQITSNLTGRVTMDGNPLPGVTVTISSPNLQGTRTAITDVNGNYNFSALPPGDYTARFEMESMQPLTRSARIGLGQSGRVDAELRLTSVAEAITVTASAPAVLETTEIQTNFQAQLIDDLPLPRNLLAQANLAPNVNTNSPSGAQLVISGAPAHENLYMVNGAVINENLRGQIHSLFIEDAIQETTVLSGAISAEYGRFTGGVVNSITKSGGNEFSGSLRDSLTNPSWSSMSYDDQPDFTDKMNSVYEGTFGGRIIRDRLWFFTAGRYTENTTDQTLFGTDVAFQFVDEETRLEGKLTGQLTSKHSLMASYLDIQRPQGPFCFIACYELSNLDVSRELPNSFITTHYSGIFTSNLLGELNYSKKKFAFEGSGGDDRTFAGGTWAYDLNTGAFFGAPVFCGTCGAEERNNDYLDAKLTYYLGSKALGTHNVSVGYQDWAEERISNNYQSGSNFGMYTFSEQTPIANEGDVFRPVIANGDFIVWYPITELSGGNEFATRSLYVNDKWDLNNNWQFNLGLRYDRNDGEDAAGNKVADDSIISPRVGGIFDVFGNGRLRFNASYGQYVAKIAEGIGGVGAANGNPAYIFYRYRGPRISGLPSPQAFAAVEQWFNAAGGTSGVTPLSATFPGISSRIDGTLESPNVQEYTLGVGSQIGRGFVRADYITREWSDFYSSRLDASTGTVLDPLGGETDLRLIETTNDGLERNYQGVSLQASYPLSDRFQLGGNYTWSETKGNVTAETSGSGPVTESAGNYYPEFTNFARNNPSGFLLSDQTHKLRAWATVAIPTPIGNFTLSALQRFDSGAAYSAIGTVNFVTDPSFGYARPNNYVGAPTTVNYYFSDRGAFRWDDTHGTDLSVNYRLRLGGAELFIQPEIINIFNNDAIFIGNTTVLTADNDADLLPFNPFTETPVEGTHYRFDEEFGQDRGTYLDFQLARTYRVSFGLRF
jgi:outer membrane receptor protein involved in Fe transport